MTRNKTLWKALLRLIFRPSKPSGAEMNNYRRSHQLQFDDLCK